MIDPTVVDLSRLQFALTALYHFLFVPLTLGLSLLLAIMESVYVMTGRAIWREMTQFWGVLFGINFAMGVATGITMEFQFGTNWAYYAQYVGDVFGTPLALEGLMAFFLEASFVGLFFFGWDRLPRLGHLIVTWLVGIGANLSALWILIANGWMQNPVGASFNAATMRMELNSFYELVFNPVAQAKFVHTVSAGYVCGSMFVLAVSAYYLLRGRHVALARRSMTVAASFGLASALSVVVLGDESGYLETVNQKLKLAAMEAMWHTKPAPASLTLFGLPDLAARTTRYQIEIPWVLGIIATRSLNTPVEGIAELLADGKKHIEAGLVAYRALLAVRQNPNDAAAKAALDKGTGDLGYALLLRRFTDNVAEATPAQIDQATESLMPDVPVMFWGFRFMAGLGFYFILLFTVAFYLASRRRLDQRWFLRIAMLSLPLPWVAIECGWIVAEYGRQPWVVEGILPTFLGVSAVPVATVIASIVGFVVFYSALAVTDVALMLRAIRRGPPLQQTASPV